MTLRALVLTLVAVVVALSPAPAVAGPEGQLTWGVHISLAPTWFDPAETPGIITPYMVLYALHDALVKPMPGNPKAPGLAESWSVSKDGLVYEFVLRKGVRFHNGDPLTSDDVKFSLERYRGAASKPLKERVAGIETPDPQRVRIRLKQPWPDFLTFYTNATGAGWIVPRKYVEKVGDEGFKKAPVGAGPYKFVSFTPGVELVLEAFEQYWRKSPSVKRLVLRVIPDESTRLAALKRGEVDIAYSIRGELAEEMQRTPGPHAEARGHPGPVLALLRRPVGSQVAVARPARAAGREPRHRPAGDQPGPHPRPLAAQREHHPDLVRVLLAAARAGPRPGPRQAAAGRGRLSLGLRRGRVLSATPPTRTWARR